MRSAAGCCARPTSLHLSTDPYLSEQCHLHFAWTVIGSSSFLPGHLPQTFRVHGNGDGTESVQEELPPPAPASLVPVLPPCPCGCSEPHGVTLSPMRQDWTDLYQGSVFFSWYDLSVGNFLDCLWPVPWLSTARRAREHPSPTAMFPCIQGLQLLYRDVLPTV